MKYPRKHINRADGNSSGGNGGYAFKTLWQEATNAFISNMEVIKAGILGKQRTDQLRDLYDIKGRQDWSISYINQTKGSSMPSILFALVVIALIVAVIFIAVKQKKA